MDRADIYSLSFHPEDPYICVSSDKGTVHIYSLITPNSAEKQKRNQQSRLAFMKEILPSYFSSEWSLSQFPIPDCRSICAFGAQKNTVIVVCSNGIFLKYSFDPAKGGEAKQEGKGRFI